MSVLQERIRQHDENTLDITKFSKRFVGCIVLTKDDKILLQQRSADFNSYPGYLSEFGGAMEAGEIPMQTLIRELHEELGAKVNAEDVVFLGAITEAITEHKELIYAYFWYDQLGTITGCYEGEARFFL